MRAVRLSGQRAPPTMSHVNDHVPTTRMSGRRGPPTSSHVKVHTTQPCTSQTPHGWGPCETAAAMIPSNMFTNENNEYEDCMKPHTREAGTLKHVSAKHKVARTLELVGSFTGCTKCSLASTTCWKNVTLDLGRQDVWRFMLLRASQCSLKHSPPDPPQG